MQLASTIAAFAAVALALPATSTNASDAQRNATLASVSIDTLTTDPLTGLPLDPATICNSQICVKYGTNNDPVKIPDALWCKSKMQSNFYTLSGFNVKMDAVVAWYAAHLTGFKRTHAYAGGSSNDTFYNAAGTMFVLVKGDRAPEGATATAYAVTYYRVQPALSEKSILGLNRMQRTCS